KQLDYDQVAQLPKENSAFHLESQSLSDY
ncbi:hypothetical protein WAJ69_22865, partial [Acinetobacter baumannii]